MSGLPAAPHTGDYFDRRTQGPAAMTHVVSGENPVQIEPIPRIERPLDHRDQTDRLGNVRSRSASLW